MCELPLLVFLSQCIFNHPLVRLPTVQLADHALHHSSSTQSYDFSERLCAHVALPYIVTCATMSHKHFLLEMQQHHAQGTQDNLFYHEPHNLTRLPWPQIIDT